MRTGYFSPLNPLKPDNKDYTPPSPEPFAWGISGSSYQYEDPAVTPRTKNAFLTDWDMMVAQGGAPEKGDGIFSWTEFSKDIDALKKIGVSHFRFSIEWARVEPQPGVYNEAVIRGYVGMARSLKAVGIEPVVCLWHFTFPGWLFDTRKNALSNWLHPLFAPRWEAFCERMVASLGSHIRYYAPQNEPNGQISTAYIAGMWPPRHVLHFKNYRQAVAASAAAFRTAARIIKRDDPDAIVMSVEALPWWHKSKLDVARSFYNETMHDNFDHLDQIYDVCDIIGFNYYYSQKAGPISLLSIPFRRGHNYTMMGWDIDPQGFYEQIKFVGERYGRPMMITENGIATSDDNKRIRYLKEHIEAMMRAKADGYDVRGYFVWSLADNYEWHYGYKATFGLSRMNPKTHVRELRPSAFYYRDLIRNRTQ